ncbi:hypothetical protein FOZ62_000285 [Perkinsus olseni]|uniref:Uncharacterized protein n=1 Tax=Perkinsus olseni TaxID=32597 RepID=A0A7J6RYU7_PEROL|nr:hypothetical protein FOZ62_000285 [Perkinsus olseni]
MSGFVEAETDDPVAFVAAARRRASKQRRSHDDITTEDRTHDLSREDVPVVREPADEHLEVVLIDLLVTDGLTAQALARLRASHAPVISPGRERQPVTHAKEQPGVEEVDRKRLSPVVAEGLSSADGATKEGDTGHVEDSGSRANRRVIEVKPVTYAEGRLEEDDELIRKLAQQAKLLLGRDRVVSALMSIPSKVKHFSRQLRRINAEKQARGKSRPREDDRLSIDARSRGLEFHRRQRERHMMNGEARNRRTRKSNSEQPGPKEDEQAAERARLEQMLQRHDRLRAAVDAFRRWLRLSCAINDWGSSSAESLRAATYHQRSVIDRAVNRISFGRCFFPPPHEAAPFQSICPRAAHFGLASLRSSCPTLMFSRRSGHLLCVVSALILSTVFCLTSHKQKTLDPSKLEYRLAKPTDVLLSDKLEDKAAVFVAFDTEAQTVVGSVEFGVVQEAVYENRETVFLPWLEMMRGWTNQDVAVEMLKHLLEYIKRVRPRVAYVWTRENWGAKEEFADKVCKKAGFKTMGAPDQWYDYMYTFPKTESSVEASGGDGVIPIIPGPYDVVE